MNLEGHLGKAIVDGGMALVAEDSLTYGSPADVVIAKARMFELIDTLAGKTNADAVRRMTAHKLGDLIVGILHSGDHAKVLSRAMADIVSVAPVVDLVVRREKRVEREEQGRDLERKITEAIDGLHAEGAAA